MAEMNKDQEYEKQIKALISDLKSRGVRVRREKLSRGIGYKVRSGSCHVMGDGIFFLDSRLSLDQQKEVLLKLKSQSE